MLSSGVIGLGRVGSTLAAGLGARLAFTVEPRNEQQQIYPGRRYQVLAEVREQVGQVLITVPDNEIPAVLAELAAHPLLSESVWIHLAGSLNLTPFASWPRHRGIAMAHPLYAFTQPHMQIPQNLVWGVNGDQVGRQAADALISHFAGHSVVVNEQFSPLYHALAVLVSNYPLALARMMEKLLTGMEPPLGERLRQGYVQLMQQTLSGLSEHSADDLLTGPARRGDDQTLTRHLQVLQTLDSDSVRVYRELAGYILRNMSHELDPEVKQHCLLALEEDSSR